PDARGERRREGDGDERLDDPDLAGEREAAVGGVGVARARGVEERDVLGEPERVEPGTLAHGCGHGDHLAEPRRLPGDPHDEAECWADYYGIPCREPPTHDFDFKLLVRAATASRRLGLAAAYGWRLCAAVYGSDVWPVDEAVCVRIAEEVGLPGSAFVSALADPETARLAASSAEEACRRGA